MALKDGLVKLKAFAAAPWFPVLVGFLSGANLFLLVMSAPLVILYCSAVLANPKRFLKQIQLEQVLGGGWEVKRLSKDFFVNLDLLCVFPLIGKIGCVFPRVVLHSSCKCSWHSPGMLSFDHPYGGERDGLHQRVLPRFLPQAICLGVGAHPKWIKWPQFDLRVRSFFLEVPREVTLWERLAKIASFYYSFWPKMSFWSAMFVTLNWSAMFVPFWRPLSPASGGLGLKAWCNPMAQLRRYLCPPLGPSWNSFEHAVFFKVFGLNL